MVNGSVALISLSDFSSSVYRNASDFCGWILYPGSLLLNPFSSETDKHVQPIWEVWVMGGTQDLMQGWCWVPNLQKPQNKRKSEYWPAKWLWDKLSLDQALSMTRLSLWPVWLLPGSGLVLHFPEVKEAASPLCPREHPADATLRHCCFATCLPWVYSLTVYEFL